VAVAWVGAELLAVGPLPQQITVAAVLGMTEAYQGAERVGMAELVTPAQATARLAARSNGAATPGAGGDRR
jgi:hypothetical protein